jgi:acetoacetyl-CoA synthetase
MLESPIWTPAPARVQGSAMWKFLQTAAATTGTAFSDYAALHRWSLQQPAAFWSLAANQLGVRFTQRPTAVFEKGSDFSQTRWFPGATLNHAAHLLGDSDNRPAILFGDERGRRRELTRADLHREVARVAAGLLAAGVQPGDRVAGFVANCPEAVIAALAVGSVGAIWSSCSPDFGVAGVVDRFGQIAPKVLFAVDGYTYAGRRIDTRATIAEVATHITSIQQVVVIAFLEDAPDVTAIANAQDFRAFGSGAPPASIATVPFDHPLCIVFSSGTTGPPKCIVHRAGGVLLQHLKEHVLHTDIGPLDRVFYFTTCGWMMWNWLLGALATGATIVLYDGSPMHPDPGVLWQLARDFQVTVFGTSAKYLSSLQKSGYLPREHGAMPRLRSVLSTGSPLAPEGFDYVYQDISPDVMLASISGGTEIFSCFALGNPLLPVYRGELQCAGLGMAVDVFDADGRTVRGDRGELVCTQPFPSQPLCFWNDADRKRFHAAYFERFEGVWAHGDFAEFTAHGGIVIHGRSDAVLNPGGVRIGTAEIYRQVELLDEVVECMAVAQPWQGDERVILFVVLRAALTLDEALRARIRDAIRRNTTARHVPAKILQVPAMPRTRSGKLVELAVRNLLRGEPVHNTLAIANPEALEAFRNRPELRD